MTLSAMRGLVSRTYSEKSLIMVLIYGFKPEEAWKTIEEQEWNEPESPDYIDANLEQELESMECQVESLMRNEVLLEYE
ncbi:hypothetical protein Tco_1165033, partial [Tanacetum coccineum]